MTVHSMTLSQKTSGCEHCPCGCAPCEETCCCLDCIVQPRFFCGQLLTDQDLSTLVQWTKDRLRLSRYTHGWGVVCGLQVLCDPNNCSRVIVKPGYAIGCCGDDIVVCEDQHFDLSGACAEEKDPCADLRPPGQSDSVSRVSLRIGNMEYQQVSQTDVRYVDLYLNYHEEPFSSQTVLGRSVCKQVAECEYARIREGGILRWKPAVAASDPVRAAAEAWREGYQKCLEVVEAFSRQFPGVGNGDTGDDTQTGAQTAMEVRRWLLRWIEEHPLQHICNLRDAICQLDDDRLLGPALPTILFLLVQECRIQYVSCDCHCCEEGHGVLLARISLRRVTDDRGRACCQVLAIDSYPPYRRDLTRECWPAPLGCFNASKLIWHRYEEACSSLAGFGARVSQSPVSLPQTISMLRRILGTISSDLFVCCGESVVVHTLDSQEFGQRVVGFSRGTAATPGNPSFSVSKQANRIFARAGERVTYVAQVVNRGDTSLIVEVDDDRADVPNNVARIDPGATREFTYAYTVADDDPDDLLTGVRVVATTPAGETLIQAASHSLTVLRGDPPDPAEIPDKDDFQAINEIAEEREGALWRNGIVSYEALSITPVEDLREVLPRAGDATLRQVKLQAARLAMEKNLQGR